MAFATQSEPQREADAPGKFAVRIANLPPHFFASEPMRTKTIPFLRRCLFEQTRGRALESALTVAQREQRVRLVLGAWTRIKKFKAKFLDFRLRITCQPLRGISDVH